MADLLELSAEIRATDPDAAAAARAGLPAGGGRLAQLGEWLAAGTGRWPATPRRVRLVSTAPLPSAVLELAGQAGVGQRDLATGPDALDAGVQAADDEIDAGTDLVLLAADDPGPAPAVVIALITGAEPVSLLPRGAAVTDSSAWIAAAVELRDRLRRSRPLRHQPGALLAELASPALAAACGFLLRAAARRTPLVLDGSAAVAAALLAADLRPRAGQWWQVADTAGDPVQARALQHLGVRPVLDLAAGTGSGLAALLALSVLRAAPALDAPQPRSTSAPEVVDE